MNLLFRRLIVLLLVLWLPYQAVAAVIMPICNAEELSEAAHPLYTQDTDSVVDSLAGHDNHGWMNHSEHTHEDAAVLGDCEACSLCHLACAGAVPAAEAKAHHGPEGNGRLAHVHESFASHSPEQLKRPPLAFLA